VLVKYTRSKQQAEKVASGSVTPISVPATWQAKAAAAAAVMQHKKQAQGVAQSPVMPMSVPTVWKINRISSSSSRGIGVGSRQRMLPQAQ
jgi:hypothetical protein